MIEERASEFSRRNSHYKISATENMVTVEKKTYRVQGFS